MRFSHHIGIAGILCAILFGATFLIKVPEFLAPTTQSAAVVGSQNIRDPWLPKGFQDKTRVLIVPGHDDAYPGGLYGDVREEDMTIQLAEKLVAALSGDDRFEVITLRDTSDGTYAPFFSRYVGENRDNIFDYVADRKNRHPGDWEENGRQYGSAEPIYHVRAAPEVRVRLFSINKWVNENDIDLVVHLHFNAYRNNADTPGQYSGMAIYVPGLQSPVLGESVAAAQQLIHRLGRLQTTSNLEQEQRGIVPDDELLALGTDNTLDVPAVLIEYGYMYEPAIYDENLREPFFTALAQETAIGLEHYFDLSVPTFDVGGEEVIETNLSRGARGVQVVELQLQLAREGRYPAAGENLRDCPITGYFGSCTQQALQNNE